MCRPGVSTDNVQCGIMMSVLYVHSGEIYFLFLFQFNELMISLRPLNPLFNLYIITVLWPLLQLFPFLHRLGYNYSIPDFGLVKSERNLSVVICL